VNENYYAQKIKQIIVSFLCLYFASITLFFFLFTGIKANADKYKTTANIIDTITETVDYIDKTEYALYQNKKTNESVANISSNINNLIIESKSLNSSDVNNKISNIETQFGILKNSIVAVENKENITLHEYDCLIKNPIKSLKEDFSDFILMVHEKVYNGKTIFFMADKMFFLFVSIIIMPVIFLVMCVKKIFAIIKEVTEKRLLAEQTADESISKAFTDNLTGLWNRKYTEIIVENVIHNKGSGCLFMMDMDNFKKVNDTYGHIAGDNVLKSFAKVMMNVSRDSDICCRIGGDEFIIFANKMPLEQASMFAKRLIHNSIAELSSVEGGTNVTVSIGIATIGDDIATFKDLYDKADKALYYIKKNGKNDYQISP